MIMTASDKVPVSRLIAHDDSLSFNGEVSFPALTFTPQYTMPEDKMWTRAAYLKKYDIFINHYHNKTAVEKLVR